MKLHWTRGICVFAVSSASVLTCEVGHTWGSYAHQQINVAAVELLQEINSKSSFSSCLNTNKYLMQRLAVSPDYEWKIVGAKVTDPELAKKRAWANKFEHPLHFFEVDAYSNSSREVPQLPSGDFTDVVDRYAKLLKANADKVGEIDPKKSIRDPNSISADDVAGHGTAPWRAKQLYQLAVKSLRSLHNKYDAKKFEMAMLYLGALGHYVGDLSQPLHAALNYDGQYYPKDTRQGTPITKGIHGAFESDMFNVLIGKGNVKDEDGAFDNFDMTDDAVLASARKSLGKGFSTPMAESLVVSELLGMITGGVDYLDRLLDGYYDTLTNENSCYRRSNEISSNLVAKNESTLLFAERRMGDSVALLARMWLAAFEEAGSPSLSKCEELEFDRGFVITNYPVPDYLPEELRRVGPQHMSKEILAHEIMDLTGSRSDLETKSDLRINANSNRKPGVDAIRCFSNHRL